MGEQGLVTRGEGSLENIDAEPRVETRDGNSNKDYKGRMGKSDTFVRGLK